jgi:hypothetical protein
LKKKAVYTIFVFSKKNQKKGIMKVKITTILKSDLETVWHYLMQPKTLEYIAKPMLQFMPIQPQQFPKTWAIGTYQTLLRVLGFIPLGSHTIVIEIPKIKNETTKSLIDNGFGKLVERWHHTIVVKKKTAETTEYTDIVDIRAGLLTPFIWAFAFAFYHWRQRRWKVLIAQEYRFL